MFFAGLKCVDFFVLLYFVSFVSATGFYMEDELILEPLHQNYVPVNSKRSHPSPPPPTPYTLGIWLELSSIQWGISLKMRSRQPVKCGLSETNNFMEISEQSSVRQLLRLWPCLVGYLHLNKRFEAWKVFWKVAFITTWWVGDLMLFEALASRAFDQLNCQHIREFDQNFSKRSNAQGIG